MVEFIEVTGRNETLQSRNFDLEREAEMLRAEVQRLVVDLAKNWSIAAGGGIAGEFELGLRR